MYKLLRYAVVFFLFTIVRQHLTFAQASLSFVENKGQWADSIHFKAELPGGRVHIQDGGLAYYFASIQDLQVIADKIEHGDSLGGQTIKLHNYKVHYKGANSSPSYSTAEQKNNYLNYFYGDDSTKWRGNIRLFEKIVQHGVYDGIDVAVYSKLNSLKYDFIIAPGADPGLIQLSFEGVMPEIMANGNLHIVTSVNEIIEQAPYAYQMIGGVEVPVDCHFELTGNLLSFSLPAGYDQQYPLIIDPELVFTTFSGGGDFQNGYFSYCTTYDAEGSLYAAGVPLWGFWPYPPEWPTTPGAFQPEYTSIYGPMVIINKYNAVGS